MRDIILAGEKIYHGWERMEDYYGILGVASAATFGKPLTALAQSGS
jgi:hypothetical protein